VIIGNTVGVKNARRPTDSPTTTAQTSQTTNVPETREPGRRAPDTGEPATGRSRSGSARGPAEAPGNAAVQVLGSRCLLSRRADDVMDHVMDHVNLVDDISADRH
jgi:hypothetical protein